MLATLSACGLNVVDGLTTHGPELPDAGAVDAATRDAGGFRDNEPDAGSQRVDMDAGMPDAGHMVEVDAGASDAGTDAALPKHDKHGSDEPVDGPLIARWRLRDPEETIAIDSSLTGADGEFLGHAKVTADGFALDGVDDSIHVPSDALDFDGAITVMLWVRTSSTSIEGQDMPSEWWKGQWLVDKDTVETTSGWAITNHFGKINFNVNPDVDTLVSIKHIDDDAWHHVAGVRAQTGARWLYVDGHLEASTDTGSTDSITNTEDLYLGSDTGKSRYGVGFIRDVQVHNAVLSSTDVQKQMKQRDW